MQLSPCPPECDFQSETKIEPDLRLIGKLLYCVENLLKSSKFNIFIFLPVFKKLKLLKALELVTCSRLVMMILEMQQATFSESGSSQLQDIDAAHRF